MQLTPAVMIAILTNVVTLIVLIVTQTMNLRTENSRRMEERCQKLRDSRRSVYQQLVEVCDQLTQETQLRTRELGPSSSPEELNPEYEGILMPDLVTAKGMVELIGSLPTIEASTKLIAAVREFVFTEDPGCEEKIRRTRRAFLEAARGDLDANLML